MRLRPTRSRFSATERSPGRRPRVAPARRRRCAGFTLAEVLAALVFMAIVIPVAIEGLRVASQAGLVGERKAVAARIAERVLNELVATGQWQRASQAGVQQEGLRDYRWQMRLDSWQSSTLRQLTVEVNFTVQGREYPVRLSTLVDPAAQ